MAYLESITYWHWLGFGVFLAILDVLIGAHFILLWSGLAAVSAGLCLYLVPSMGWEWQFLIFGLGVFMSLVVWRFYLKKMPRVSSAPHLNRRADQYLGRDFTLEQGIVNGRGHMRVDDTQWRIEGEDFPKGTRVKVVAVDGVVLKVEKLESSV